MKPSTLLPLLLPLLSTLPTPASADDKLYLTGGLKVGTASDLTITVYSTATCAGGSNTWTGKTYGEQQTWTSGFRSYKLSRDLHANEQLDFSTSADSKTGGALGKNEDKIMDVSASPDSCGVFTKKATKDADRKGGVCRGVEPNSACVNLWLDS